jgi:hypothetical protein
MNNRPKTLFCDPKRQQRHGRFLFRAVPVAAVLLHEPVVGASCRPRSSPIARDARIRTVLAPPRTFGLQHEKVRWSRRIDAVAVHAFYVIARNDQPGQLSV